MPTRRALILATCAAPFVQAAGADDMARTLQLPELYNRDKSFSDLAQSLEGQRITVGGFMAPPLKAQSQFFVLTRMPMSVCPFCETGADWPPDILAIYTRRIVDVTPYDKKIEVRGILDLGSYRDPETGFLSRVRLNAATYQSS